MPSLGKPISLSPLFLSSRGWINWRLNDEHRHFTTAVFATCGMNIWIFTLAAVLSLPKQVSKSARDEELSGGLTDALFALFFFLLAHCGLPRCHV